MENETQKKYIKKIKGDNVYLSPISLDDTEQYTHMINDLKVSVGIGHPAYINIMDYEREREFLNSIKDGKIFAVRLIENDELLGNIELFNVNILQKNAYLGIMLGNPEYQRKGYGKEAINLILDYGFSFLNLYSISLTVFEYNEVAYNLYKKIGFKEVGRMRKRVEIMGKRYDEIIMDILKEEFESVYIKREIEGRYKLYC